MKTTKEQLSIKLGDHMCLFDFREPTINSNILYLLGNAITGIEKHCQLVRGKYNPDFGDFEKDKNGKHKYVTHCRYITNL